MTRPKTRSPGKTLVSLTLTSRICGGESGATRTGWLGGGGTIALGGFAVGDALGAAVAAEGGATGAVGPTLGTADGRRSDAEREDGAADGALTVAVGCGPVDCNGWLQPEITRRAAPVKAARA